MGRFRLAVPYMIGLAIIEIALAKLSGPEWLMHWIWSLTFSKGLIYLVLQNVGLYLVLGIFVYPYYYSPYRNLPGPGVGSIIDVIFVSHAYRAPYLVMALLSSSTKRPAEISPHGSRKCPTAVCCAFEGF